MKYLNKKIIASSKKIEDFRLQKNNSNIQDGVLNIKPLVNLTINKLGLLDTDDDPAADTPTNVLKSMFNIWNPEVCRQSTHLPS